MPLLGYAVRFAKQPLTFVEALRPAGDVVRIRLGPRTLYWVNQPDLVRQVLADAGTFGNSSTRTGGPTTGRS